jgi:hypothetical protein
MEQPLIPAFGLRRCIALWCHFEPRYGFPGRSACVGFGARDHSKAGQACSSLLAATGQIASKFLRR